MPLSDVIKGKSSENINWYRFFIYLVTLKENKFGIDWLNRLHMQIDFMKHKLTGVVVAEFVVRKCMPCIM